MPNVCFKCNVELNSNECSLCCSCKDEINNNSQEQQLQTLCDSLLSQLEQIIAYLHSKDDTFSIV